MSISNQRLNDLLERAYDGTFFQGAKPVRDHEIKDILTELRNLRNDIKILEDSYEIRLKNLRTQAYRDTFNAALNATTVAMLQHKKSMTRDYMEECIDVAHDLATKVHGTLE